MSVLTQIEAAMSLTGAARYEQAARALLQNEWEIMNTRVELMADPTRKIQRFLNDCIEVFPKGKLTNLAIELSENIICSWPTTPEREGLI